MVDVDLAIVGAGAAGTWVAQAMQQARPEWSIALIERHERPGGRLRSVKVPGVEHPIELGGMRYLTSHPLAQRVVTELGLESRLFDTTGGREHSYLRGVFGSGPDDPGAGRGYDLREDERGRAATDLALDAFGKIVPGVESIDAADWPAIRRSARYLDRPLTDWSFAEAVGSVRSPDGHRFVTDAFGYDSGIRPHNVGDAIPYLLGGSVLGGESRVPIGGMARIPGALTARFQAGGGRVLLGHDVARLSMEAGTVHLHLVDGGSITAARVVLAMPVSALRWLARESPAIAGYRHEEIYGAVEGFPATKLYTWYDRPWWRSHERGPSGIRTTTDLPIRKIFYYDEHAERPSALLASYADGRDSAPILALAGGVSNGESAPAALLEQVREDLATIHPGADIPPPMGSAFMHWGSDPREIAWTYWRAGVNSDEMIEAAIQPDPAVPIYICGESFSRMQAWVDGAFETAAMVAERLAHRP
jgi:monoamine oxidase